MGKMLAAAKADLEPDRARHRAEPGPEVQLTGGRNCDGEPRQQFCDERLSSGTQCPAAPTPENPPRRLRPHTASKGAAQAVGEIGSLPGETAFGIRRPAEMAIGG